MGRRREGEEKSALLPSSSRASNEVDYGSTTVSHLKSVQIAWHHLRADHPKSGKTILDDVYGVVEPGELVALMGSSGAGKTTLLNVLLGRNLKGLEVSGDVIINGRKTNTSQIMDISGYVQQDELFVATLTVREHLNIQANLRLVHMNSSQRQKRVNEVIKELGLRKCQNSRIGVSGIKKGISGGEAKRLSFASELLDNPPLLFCDEPTTGLDSSMAESVVNLMRVLASSGHTIICTIHQPSSAIFNKFDKVMFLASGRLSYFGTPLDSIKLFKSFGYPCPANYNPADLIVDILSVESGKEAECRERIQKISDQFHRSEAGKQLQHRIECSKLSMNERKEENAFREMAPIYLQIWSLLKRAFIDNYRNPGLARAKIIQKIFMGVFVGLLYFQTPINRVGVSNINGSIFYLVSELTYSTLFGILSFLPAEYPLLVREYHDSMYYLPCYYIARILSYIPLFTLDGTFMVTIAYWMTGLTPTIPKFLIAIGIAILSEQSAAAFGVMISSCSPSYAVAVSIAGPLLSILSLTGGLYANIGELPVWISWFQYISWFRYGFEAMSINQWTGVEQFSSQNNCVLPIDEDFNDFFKKDAENPNCLSADDILEMFSFHRSNFYFDLIVMFGCIFIFYLIGFFGLLARVRKSR